MRMKASTIIELLIVMIITGIVIGLTFEGVDIFRRYSRKITNEIVTRNDLLNQYLSLQTIIGKSDSLTLHKELVQLHRKGTVFGELSVEDSLLLLHFVNTTDTLPIKVVSLDVKAGMQTDTLIVHTKTITLLFNTVEQAEIATKKNRYDEGN